MHQPLNRVLIVEDEPQFYLNYFQDKTKWERKFLIVRRKNSKKLEKILFRTIREELLSTTEERAALILDLCLPPYYKKEEGFSYLSKLKSEFGHRLPIIVISNVYDISWHASALELGAADMIHKMELTQAVGDGLNDRVHRIIDVQASKSKDSVVKKKSTGDTLLRTRSSDLQLIVTRLLDAIQQKDIPIVLSGPPGSGKLFIIQKLFNSHPLAVIDWALLDQAPDLPDPWYAYKPAIKRFDYSSASDTERVLVFTNISTARDHQKQKKLLHLLHSGKQVVLLSRQYEHISDMESGQHFLPELHQLIIERQLKLPPLSARLEDLDIIMTDLIADPRVCPPHYFGGNRPSFGDKTMTALHTFGASRGWDSNIRGLREDIRKIIIKAETTANWPKDGIIEINWEDFDFPWKYQTVPPHKSNSDKRFTLVALEEEKLDVIIEACKKAGKSPKELGLEDQVLEIYRREPGLFVRDTCSGIIDDFHLKPCKKPIHIFELHGCLAGKEAFDQLRTYCHFLERHYPVTFYPFFPDALVDDKYFDLVTQRLDNSQILLLILTPELISATKRLKSLLDLLLQKLTSTQSELNILPLVIKKYPYHHHPQLQRTYLRHLYQYPDPAAFYMEIADELKSIVESHCG